VVIQIFGHSKCQDTKKAERFFKERKIVYQLIDITVKGMSKGELTSVKSALGLEALISKTCKSYVALNMDKIRTPEVREELLLKNPLLLQTPVVRYGKLATVGYMPERWLEWLKP